MIFPRRREAPDAVLETRQFNNIFKRAIQTDRHRIKLLSVAEQAKLLRKYELTSSRDWLGHGPYSVSIGTLRVAHVKIS